MKLRLLTTLGSVVVVLVCTFVITAQDTQNVTEVTLEVAPDSYGYMRSFKITLRQDGYAAFHGKAGVSLIGKYKGTIRTEAFDQLAKLLTVKHFAKMKGEFLPPTAFAGSQNMPTITAGYIRTTAVINGKRRTVSRPTNIKIDSSSRIPEGLLDIESAITRFATSIKWAKEDE